MPGARRFKQDHLAVFGEHEEFAKSDGGRKQSAMVMKNLAALVRSGKHQDGRSQFRAFGEFLDGRIHDFRKSYRLNAGDFGRPNHKVGRSRGDAT
jgi:hypothetical protein